MDIIFGKFINVFNDFVSGKLSPAGYRDEVGKYRYASKHIWLERHSLTCGIVFTLCISSLGNLSYHTFGW